MADAEAKDAKASAEKDIDAKDAVDKSQGDSTAREEPGNAEAGAAKPTEPEDAKDDPNEHGEQANDENDDSGEGKSAVGSKRALEEANDEEAPAAKKAKPFPVTLGYCTFEDSKAATKYFRDLLSQYPVDTPLNEYEFKAVAALLREGHTHPRRKIGKGIKAITLKRVSIHSSQSTCYFLHRVDGTSDDFSYRKCLANLLGEELTPIQRDSRGFGRGGRRGDGGGRRGGGRRGRGRGPGRN